MGEVRRYLRYTLPGLACMLELLAAFSVSNWNATSGAVKSVFVLPGAAGALGAAAGVLVVSGGVGYILAVLYFALYWTPGVRRLLAIDHRPIFQSLGEHLRVLDIRQERPVDTDTLTKRDAWAIVAQWWYSVLESDPAVAGVNRMTDRLVDFTHALGATLTGTLIAGIVWGVTHYRIWDPLNPTVTNEALVYGFWIVLLVVLLFLHQLTLRGLERLVNSTVVAVMRARSGGSPTTLYYQCRESQIKRGDSTAPN